MAGPYIDQLTSGQIQFCLAYQASGRKNKTAAYLSAFPNTTRESAGVTAHRLLKQPKIQRFLESLANTPMELARQEAEEKKKQALIADAQELQETTTKILRDESLSPQARLKAIELMARMMGLLSDKVTVEQPAPFKVEVEVVGS